MNGDMVIVRDFQGKPLVRRVWESNNAKVYICTNETYQLLLVGNSQRYPIGFPHKDVFRYDKNKWDAIEKNYRKASAWEQLEAWSRDKENEQPRRKRTGYRPLKQRELLCV